ncbi:cytochrome P450 [Streptomyces sp. NPDC057909]|uniref:cytochrome P450 n=1 Tax=Streptomyces sp. NPDC057909 TaxID=3346277 RepID=UPI0036EC8695
MIVAINNSYLRRVCVKPLLDGITEAPGALPLLGHTLSLLRDPLAFLESLPAEADLVQIRFGPLRAVVVRDVELSRQVLREDQIFDKGGPLFEQIREVLGYGLGTCPYSEHRRQRRLTQPAFHRSRFSGYTQVMTAQAAAMTSDWRDGEILDVLPEMMTLTIRTVAETMFSGALPSDRFETVIEDLSVIVGGIYRRALMPPVLNQLLTPANRRYHQARIRLRRTLGDIIMERRADANDRCDLLSALLAARTDDAQGMTDTEISDQVITFFAAGSETTAVLLSWVLYLLALHPEIEERVHAEATLVLENSPAAKFEHLPDLRLTGHVITETLRMYPPLWMLTRTATVDTQLGRYALPAGTTMVYSPYLIHHRSDLYVDRDRFDPDRWESAQLPRGAFIPFGAGARRCIGDQFGIAEAVLTLATITARWRLMSVPGQRVRPVAASTLKPRGLKLRAIMRGKSTHG